MLGNAKATVVDAIAVVAASFPVAVVAARAYIEKETVDAAEAAADAAAAHADAAAAAAAGADATPKAKTRVNTAHRHSKGPRMPQRTLLTFWISLRT